MNPFFYLKLAAVLVIPALVFGVGYKFADARCAAAAAKQQAAVAKHYAALALAYNDLSLKYEEKRHERTAAAKVIEKRITKIVERPIYRNVCLDDSGVSIVNDAIRGTSVTGQPDSPMP